MRAGAENFTHKPLNRLAPAIDHNEAYEAACIAWRCAQDVRAACRAADLTEGMKRAEKVLTPSHLPDPRSCA